MSASDFWFTSLVGCAFAVSFLFVVSNFILIEDKLSFFLCWSGVLALSTLGDRMNPDGVYTTPVGDATSFTYGLGAQSWLDPFSWISLYLTRIDLLMKIYHGKSLALLLQKINGVWKIHFSNKIDWSAENIGEHPKYLFKWALLKLKLYGVSLCWMVIC